MPNIQQLCCWQIAAACLVDTTWADIVAGLQKLEAIDWRRDEHFDLGQLFARLRPLKRTVMGKSALCSKSRFVFMLGP